MLGPTQKALEINLDKKIYGVFAEIGAGQEVVRHFFRAGGAAGTIAKSMSAYDMNVSDAIYGKTGRYVSIKRLKTMLLREFEQLEDRLKKERGEDTSFFVFADTVAAKSYTTKKEGSGWIGVLFQHTPGVIPSQVILHINMFDKSNLQQQEAIGILGVNLIYACYHYGGETGGPFIRSLMDNLSPDQIEIDMIEVSGPSFDGVDSRLWSLELVKQNLCYSIMFDPKGEISLPKDFLYDKNILVCRGSYRPPTLLHMDMMEQGSKVFKKTLAKNEQNNILLLPEISMNQLLERDGDLDNQDFLARVDLLGILGYHTMISNYQTHSELSFYLSKCSKKWISMVVASYAMENIFDEKSYSDDPGKILTEIGKLIGEKTRLYCYPTFDEQSQKIISLKDIKKKEGSKMLIDYLEMRDVLHDITEYNQNCFKIWSRTVLKMIQQGESEWEKMVSNKAVKEIKKNRLFGCHTPPR